MTLNTAGDYRKRAREIAQKIGIDPDLYERQIQQESNFNPNATSPAGAQGLAQLMPGTAKDLGVTDPFDVDQNLDAGARYFKQQLDKFKDPKLALAAYNAGPGNVQKHNGVPPFPETQNYVERILGPDKKDEIKSPQTSDFQLNPRKGLFGSQLASGLSVDPSFQAEPSLEQPAIGGEEAPKKRSRLFSGLKKFFQGKEIEGGVDELGFDRPDLREQSSFGKIMSYILPMLFAGPVAGGIAGMAGSAARRGSLNKEEMDRYEKERMAAIKANEPSDLSKQISEFSDPTKLKALEAFSSAKNPLGFQNADANQSYRDAMLQIQRDRLNLDRDKLKSGGSSGGGGKAEMNLRKEYNSTPAVKDYNEADVSIRKIRAAATAKDRSGYDDQALIFDFMRILDPGSVVREGEYATAQKNASFFDRMGLKVDQVLSGQQLAPDQRQNLLRTAERLFQERKTKKEETDSFYQGIAQDSGIEPTKILAGYKSLKKQSVGQSSPQAVSHSQDSEALQWAKSNPNDPRAQQILKANGI